MIEFLGVLALLTWGVYASAIALLNPAVLAAKFQTGSLPQLLTLAELPPLAPSTYVVIAQVLSGLFIALSALIGVNKDRRAASQLLALILLVKTFLLQVDMVNPERITPQQAVHFLKNLAVVGGFWILASQKRASRSATTPSPSPPRTPSPGTTRKQ